jgi:hypothetical protein
MKEYIEKGALLENLKKQYGEELGWRCTVNMSDIGMMIEDATAADVVEVVRCKDCMWYMPLGDQYTYKGKQAMHCFRNSWLVKEDGYCDEGVLKPSAPKSKTKIVGKFTAERSAE